MPAPSDFRPRVQVQASTSFVAALTDQEICPLCLDGYAPVDELICAICEAPACPGCVEQLDGASASSRATTRCFACRPALVPPPVLPSRAPARPIAARHASVPPPLPRRQPPPLPIRSAHDGAEPDEGGLVVFPAWRKRPLLALARAADAVHLVEVSSLLVGWAHTGGRRFALAERVSRVSREWTLTLRRRGADLGRHGLRLSLPLLTGLRLRGATLSRALKVRALVLMARTARLSRQVPRAARVAWSHLPGTLASRARDSRAART